MSDQSLPQHAVYAGVPTGQNPYALTPQRQPLSPRQKRGAIWAGIVGFNLLSLGWALFVIPLVAALFGALFAVVLGQVRRSTSGSAEGTQQFLDFFDSMDVGMLLMFGSIAVVLGLIFMALAILFSRIILRAHAVHRPTAVSWAGAGVAVVGSWFISWLPGLVAQLVGGLMMSTDSRSVGAAVAAGGLYILVSIAATSLVGWLAWWWMAHVFRGDASQATAANSMTTVQE